MRLRFSGGGIGFSIHNTVVRRERTKKRDAGCQTRLSHMNDNARACMRREAGRTVNEFKKTRPKKNRAKSKKGLGRGRE